MLRTAFAAAIALTLASTLAAPAARAQEAPSRAAVAPEFRLKGDTVSIPFVMVREFPFVEVQINGVKGKLMFDTGASEALALNQNPFKLPEGRAIGRGNFASGQSYDVILRPSVDDVRLPGGLSYDRVTTFRSQDAAQLERITPDFLGWLGYQFWDGYAVKVDYKASKATFYKGGPKAFLKGETVIAAIPFETPKLPNNPVLTAKIGDTDFETVLDTGQYGNLFADKATLEQLTAAGAITPTPGEKGAIDLKAAQFAKGPAIPLAKIGSHPIEGAAPFAKAIGLTSPRIMTLGYAFLRQYKTVWDYPNKTLYLLKR
ncbi:hypothetical protein [Caulobacter sp.]|uniref:hypothetical protein n=1 Tax=Caulobacter sp. TaxID=78 RepID=UPI001B20B64E|nr:hypothetical protein [Caulobacter sp.]MBO9547743.1 hypothetical protein [Caulobacter sp.]